MKAACRAWRLIQIKAGALVPDRLDAGSEFLPVLPFSLSPGPIRGSFFALSLTKRAGFGGTVRTG